VVPNSSAPTERNQLLASIRGAGGVGALKHVKQPEVTSPSLTSPVEDTSAGGGGDLATALASALSARNKVLANSDSEEEDDDDWDES
ncbi:hypothetical protein K7432_015745, partial [Basidiobolus ranarum]